MSGSIHKTEPLAPPLDRFAALVKLKKRRLMEVRRAFRNWPRVVLLKLGFISHARAEWRSGGSTLIESPEDLTNLQEGSLWCVELLKAYGCRASVADDEIRLVYHDKPLRFRIVPMRKVCGVLLEQFAYEDYKWLSVRGKQVLDVGASIGDTAVFFAIRGAAHVYALEPYPHSYRLAETNIRLNGLEGQVTLLNMGCGIEGTVMVNPEFRNDPASELVPCEVGEEIPILTLKQIVEKFGLGDAVAKIDCEGGEYELILGAGDEELRAFGQMIIEYHWGAGSLLRRLEMAGFHVTRMPHFQLKDQSSGGNREVGFIKADRLPNLNVGDSIRSDHLIFC